jgi:hypothetical protein
MRNVVSTRLGGDCPAAWSRCFGGSLVQRTHDLYQLYISLLNVDDMQQCISSIECPCGATNIDVKINAPLN